MAGQDGFERVGQKQRTRSALLLAARELLAEGGTPTVPAAADRAGISRATAYRYFSTPEQLAREALLDAIARRFEQLELDQPRELDPAARAERAVAAILAMVLANEALFRRYLALAAAEGGQRGGRRLRWLAEALGPVLDGLPRAHGERLLNALSLVAGIETILVLKDVCGEDADRLVATARWVARTLVVGALHEEADGPPASASG